MRRVGGGSWLAYAAAVYAVVSFSWALGGTAGVGTLGGLEEMARVGGRRCCGRVGVVLALALGAAGGRVVPRRLLRIGAWTGAVVLVVYGGLDVAVGALGLGGVVEAAGAEDRVALWWHVLVWDLWFLVWGVLLGLAAWRFGKRGLSASAARAGGPGAGG